jgi:hypothetical protein
MHLVFVFGPPAVGKMTVGREVAARTGYKLLHNHMTVEPVLDVFPFGSPPFGRLVNEFRRRILEEAVLALDGLVMTMVWGLELEEDLTLVSSYVDLVERSGGRVTFVELDAPLDERLARNNTELRLQAKRSKRDPEFNDANVVELESYVMNTQAGARTIAEDLLDGHAHVRIVKEALSPEAGAHRVVANV